MQRSVAADRLAYELVFANSVSSATSGRTTRVLGIDPGLTRCGYAVVDGRGAGSAQAISMGVIRTPASDPLPARLATLRLEFTALISEFRPDVVAVEQVFFQVNVRTAMATGQASGLALAEASLAGCEVIQYTPNQVKDAVTGWGGADKLQVQKMVQQRLKLASLPRSPDAADAAALALTHLAMSPIGRQLRNGAAHHNTAAGRSAAMRGPR
jgi:crossover junction endodeoxyribonuclease RuvC